MKTNMRERIKNFVASGEKSLNLNKMVSISTMDSILGSIGYKKEEFESNGWQVDFWQTWRLKGAEYSYTMSGSLYYGEFVLTRNDNSTNDTEVEF